MSMFCFQCEQTAGGKGCTKVGVCGKNETVANNQDELTCALVGLARAAEKKRLKKPLFLLWKDFSQLSQT